MGGRILASDNEIPQMSFNSMPPRLLISCWGHILVSLFVSPPRQSVRGQVCARAHVLFVCVLACVWWVLGIARASRSAQQACVERQAEISCSHAPP